MTSPPPAPNPGEIERGTRDERIFAIAAAQRSRVTRRQLLAAGIGAKTIDRLARAALLRRVHCGVFAVGPDVAIPLADETAALLSVRVRHLGYEIDFFWPDEGVAVEIDGFAFHSTRDRFENDRARDAKLRKAGILVLRVTWRQLEREPEAVIVDVAQALVRTPR